MQPHAILRIGIAIFALTGCEDELYEVGPAAYATSEGYAPPTAEQQQAQTLAPQQISADYAIPKENPHGDLRVTSYGLVDVGARDQSDQSHRVAALHLRMALTNDSDQPWTIDTREQRISLEGYGS